MMQTSPLCRGLNGMQVLTLPFAWEPTRILLAVVSGQEEQKTCASGRS